MGRWKMERMERMVGRLGGEEIGDYGNGDEKVFKGQDHGIG